MTQPYNREQRAVQHIIKTLESQPHPVTIPELAVLSGRAQSTVSGALQVAGYASVGMRGRHKLFAARHAVSTPATSAPTPTSTLVWSSVPTPTAPREPVWTADLILEVGVAITKLRGLGFTVHFSGETNGKG